MIWGFNLSYRKVLHPGVWQYFCDQVQEIGPENTEGGAPWINLDYTGTSNLEDSIPILASLLKSCLTLHKLAASVSLYIKQS